MTILIGVRRNGDYGYHVHPYQTRWSAWHAILRASGFDRALCSVPTEAEAKTLVAELNTRRRKRD
jgi:hypothetical protein